jgi:hypothetical protein
MLSPINFHVKTHDEVNPTRTCLLVNRIFYQWLPISGQQIQQILWGSSVTSFR